LGFLVFGVYASFEVSYAKEVAIQGPCLRPLTLPSGLPGLWKALLRAVQEQMALSCSYIKEKKK
jgi:hypothetical protein